MKHTSVTKNYHLSKSAAQNCLLNWYFVRKKSWFARKRSVIVNCLTGHKSNEIMSIRSSRRDHNHFHLVYLPTSSYVHFISCNNELVIQIAKGYARVHHNNVCIRAIIMYNEMSCINKFFQILTQLSRTQLNKQINQP